MRRFEEELNREKRLAEFTDKQPIEKCAEFENRQPVQKCTGSDEKCAETVMKPVEKCNEAANKDSTTAAPPCGLRRKRPITLIYRTPKAALIDISVSFFVIFDYI